jgi:hypothetical protein
MRSRRIFLILFAAASVALSGCAIQDPDAPPRTSSSKAARPLPSSLHTTGTADSAAYLIARYANVWANWSATTLSHQRSELLTLATGQLANELRRDAAQAVKTQLQEVSDAYSHGHYVGVIPQGGGRAIVVTYEEVAPEGGQAQGAYHVYLAQTAHTTSGWRLTEWQPATDS